MNDALVMMSRMEEASTCKAAISISLSPGGFINRAERYVSPIMGEKCQILRMVLSQETEELELTNEISEKLAVTLRIFHIFLNMD